MPAGRERHGHPGPPHGARPDRAGPAAGPPRFRLRPRPPPPALPGPPPRGPGPRRPLARGRARGRAEARDASRARPRWRAERASPAPRASRPRPRRRAGPAPVPHAPSAPALAARGGRCSALPVTRRAIVMATPRWARKCSSRASGGDTSGVARDAASGARRGPVAAAEGVRTGTATSIATADTQPPAPAALPPAPPAATGTPARRAAARRGAMAAGLQRRRGRCRGAGRRHQVSAAPPAPPAGAHSGALEAAARVCPPVRVAGDLLQLSAHREPPRESLRELLLCLPFLAARGRGGIGLGVPRRLFIVYGCHCGATLARLSSF